MCQILCDVLIFGAGVTGASLALVFAQSGYNVILIDKNYPSGSEESNSIEPYARVSAINYSSVKFFKKINVWKKIPSKFCVAYHRLEVWEWSCSKITFHSLSLGLSYMGYIIENNRLQLALWERLQELNSVITLYYSCMLVSIYYNGIYWECMLDNGKKIFSYFLVGADGKYSNIRKTLGISTSMKQYHQSCMILTIKTEKYIPGTIWQVFTPNGPVGFLPLYENWGSLMWYDTPDCIRNLQRLPTKILEKKIESNFQQKLGNVKLYNITVVPLISQRSHRYTSPGAALIGDAACTIHPLAGQGLNLGLRDVTGLSNLLIHSVDFQKHANITKILTSYNNNRQLDAFIMQTSINWLYTIFHNNYLPLTIIRNIAMMGAEKSLYIKKKLLEYAMGII